MFVSREIHSVLVGWLPRASPHGSCCCHQTRRALTSPHNHQLSLSHDPNNSPQLKSYHPVTSFSCSSTTSSFFSCHRTSALYLGCLANISSAFPSCNNKHAVPYGFHPCSYTFPQCHQTRQSSSSSHRPHDGGKQQVDSNSSSDEAESGPEPSYGIAKGYKTFVYENKQKPFVTAVYWWNEYKTKQQRQQTRTTITTPTTTTSNNSSSGVDLLSLGVLPELHVAYESWGQLNCNRDNAILLTGGLSSSSHAKSHSDNTDPGWWEDFIGPGRALDTNHFYVVCTNNLGSCYGTSGPSSINPITNTNYALSFPFFTVQDMVHAQFLLLDHLGISKLYAVVGSSLGGMQSLAAAALYPHRVGRFVSISAAAISHPQTIALRYSQRRALMADPHFNGGNYYNSTYPQTGMTLAREIATVTYRSGPEWEQRFGRKRRLQANRKLAPPGAYIQQQQRHHPDGAEEGQGSGGGVLEEDYWCPPTLEPDFLIESYLEHQGRKFCNRYDPNSLILISKAMDLFTIAQPSPLPPCSSPSTVTSSPLIPPTAAPAVPPHITCNERSLTSARVGELGKVGEMTSDMLRALQHVQMPALIMGAQSDRLFPIWQQKQISDMLRGVGNSCVTYYELDAIYGHDTFLLDVVNVGAAVKGHLEQHKKWCGGGTGPR
eukprot:GHVS01093789.1.p1 GENE.GHVS01093789.1~~GHVS01093789.1.p1  ORF type:complete len:659 (-),score=106.12 GHVS01093789.1:3835-5811(-)